MAGLIEALGGSTGDPNKDRAINQGILQAGLAMLQSRGSFGQALGQGGMAGIQGMQNEQEQQFLAQQRLQQQQQWAEQNRQFERRKQMEALAPQFQRSAAGNAMSNGKGPTLENAANLGNAKPSFDWNGYIAAVEGVDPIKALELRALTSKDDAPVILSEGQTAFGRDGRVKFGNPKAATPEKPTSDIQEFEYAKRNGEIPAGMGFTDWMRANKRAGATSVNVSTDNLGLKPKDRFEMEGKLGDDYRASTKTDQSIIGSAAKINELLKQKGALKDQGAIYSFAKMLDPDGAVREADYAAIANTAGGVDRIRNLLNRALTGEQLTETQRQDMAKITNAFGKVAAERIKRANKQYGDQAKRYNLDPAAFSNEPPKFGEEEGLDLGGGFRVKK